MAKPFPSAEHLGGGRGRTPQPAPVRHHPVVLEQQAQRFQNVQLRIADAITAFAGSMPFVYSSTPSCSRCGCSSRVDPWPKLTLIVSLEAIFLSTSVMIGQNRQPRSNRKRPTTTSSSRTRS